MISCTAMRTLRRCWAPRPILSARVFRAARARPASTRSDIVVTAIMTRPLRHYYASDRAMLPDVRASRGRLETYSPGSNLRAGDSIGYVARLAREGAARQSRFTLTSGDVEARSPPVPYMREGCTRASNKGPEIRSSFALRHPGPFEMRNRSKSLLRRI